MRILASKIHKETMLHALREVVEQGKKNRMTYYGKLALWELEEYIEFLEKQEQDPIELYLNGKCPECGVRLQYETTCFCPQCGKEWWGDHVLKEFYISSDPMFMDTDDTSILAAAK